MYEDVVAVRDELAELVNRLDPEVFTASAARELWRVFDGAERLCAAGKTLLARRIAETHRPTNGTRSAAEELARAAGSGTGAAKDSIDTAQRLRDQPAVERAVRGGKLSAQQAALISGAAAADPSQADRLVDAAQTMSLPELREECGRVRAAADPDPEATNRRLHQQRCLRRYTDTEGFWNLHAKGTPQAGAAITAVLATLTDRLFQQARREGRHESYEAYAFDALATMADHAATNTGTNTGPHNDAGSTTDTGRREPDSDRCTDSEPNNDQDHSARPGSDGPAGERGNDQGRPARPEVNGAGTLWDSLGSVDLEPATPTDADEPDHPPVWSPADRVETIGRRGIPARYLALLRVDVEALRRGQLAGDEICEIRGIGPVPVPAAQGLLGEAILKLVITRGVDVVHVTHLGRGPTIAQKIALAWQTPTCTVAGCWRTRVEHDHRQPWAQTKHTRLDELDRLCEFHHDLKTRYDWALIAGIGKRPLVPPHDPRHPHTRTPSREARAP